MHARHRSPGGGGRSNSMGMGLAASRISPEGSIRGHGMYNPEFRNYNRGFGRGPPKSYPPPQPPRKGDAFMEAGRLAAEYLVSKGLLPPNVLPGKWQNGSLKNQVADFPEYRQQDRENMQLPPEGRMSALARLGNAVPEGGSGRRRFPDEFHPTGMRSHMRGRRRMGSFRGSFGSDWSRENGRSGSFSERTKSFPDMEGEDALNSGYHEERWAGSDVGSGVPKVGSNELLPKSDSAGDAEPELENYEFPDDTCSKVSSSSSRRELPLDTEGECSKGSDDSRILGAERGEVKNDTSNDEQEKQHSAEETTSQHCSLDGGSTSKNGNDLLKLCNFAKVPTKIRSSLACKALKVEPNPTTEEGVVSDIVNSKSPQIVIEEDSVEGASNDALTNQAHSSTCIKSDIPRVTSVQSMEDTGNLNPAFSVDRSKCMKSQSFHEGSSFMHQEEPGQDVGNLNPAFSVDRSKCMRSQSFHEGSSFTHPEEPGQGPPGFGRCSSMGNKRGQKRSLQHDGMREGAKKPREWSSSIVTQANDYFHLHDSREKQSSTPEEISSDDDVVEVVNQERLVNAVQHDDVKEGGKKPKEWPPAIVTQANEYLHLHNLRAKPSSTPEESPSADDNVVEVVNQERPVDAVQHDDMMETANKPREWSSSFFMQANEYFHLHNLRTKQLDEPEVRPSPDDDVVEVVNQEKLVNTDLFPKSGAGMGIEFREEKQLFPSSFKICDLNLMETSDMTENHDDDPVLGFPSTLEGKKEVSVDVDLSISNNCNRSDGYGRCPVNAKEVAIDDVANEAVKEENAHNISQRGIATLYPNMENFPNHTENTGDLPDVQDGYGLMISELLGTDIPNCSSVPADISGLHTEIGLHNGEGILGEVDPIYLSLGEIPISMPDI
ncbi:PREDICTED: uncharacterized protein At4g26450-like isoform X2 [Nelumbo nucifera]|uniref:Uncharacterized protein n=2 Tax=Nelumbo nucifera TaxID=4432 RepID=A0A822ZDY1_NELNU|nr:PREDICTED: uncharacterized protein At4g26450-like isoform X2 [Nelumbo nucifera]DAD43342.1 TPA_asm: hypothetical protein HUJ06_001572 [Nelumbo nucifera]